MKMHPSKLLALAACLALIGASLPKNGPVPLQKPSDAVEPSAPEAAPRTEAPVPEPKPSPAPGTQSDKAEQAETGEPPAEATKEEEPPPSAIVEEDQARYSQCLVDLKAMGAKFQEVDPISEDEGGCGIEKPLMLQEALPGIRLSEPSPMRCPAALALSHWLKDTVQPAASIAFPGDRITGLRNASTYTCRKRNNAETGKISEHARGNAIDVIAIELDKGKAVEMTPKAEDSTMTGAFQRTATAGACLHFTTVLSPGSDATHEDHLHLDILERKGGYRYCR